MVIRNLDGSSELVALETASAVIDAVGGTVEAQKLTRKKTPQVVTNWRAAGRLPPDTFLVLRAELRARGFTAPAALWGITDPDAAAVAACESE